MSDFDFGPLAGLMTEENIHTIYVNDPEHIFVWHRWEGYKAADVSFQNSLDLAQFAQGLAQSVGASLDATNPIAELRLADGSHATLMVAPVATQGAVMQISKPITDRFTMDKMVAIGAASANAAKFLTACVRARMNIAVVGGFNSGKTTFLNVLVDEVSQLARLAVIQPISSLAISHPDSIILESRKADIHGNGAITNRHLLAHTLELHPHRIVIAELDGTEADLLLNALDTGYSSLFAMSGAGARDALARLETAAARNNLSMPLLSIREQLARTIDLIVHVELFELGDIALKRMIGIHEVRGMKGDSIDVVQLFERPRDRDELLALGEVSQLLGRIRQLGRSEVDEAWFQP